MLQKYSMAKLQTILGTWLPRDVKLLSLSISKTELKAVVYVKDDGEGVDFSYSCDLTEEAQNYAWLKDDEALNCALVPLTKLLAKEGYGEEKLKVVVILEDYCFTELLDLPELNKKDLEEALNWEVPEHAPWEKGSFSFQYLVKKSAEMTEGQINDGVLAKLQQVYIYAVENVCVELVPKMAKSKNWELVAITVAEFLEQEQNYTQQLSTVDFYQENYTSEQLGVMQAKYAVPIVAVRAYLQGKLNVNFLSREDKRKIFVASYNGLWQALTCCFLGLSMLAGGLSYGYHYKEVKELKELQQKEKHLDIWQERMQETKLLQAKEKRLNQQIKLLETRKVRWSGLLRELGRLVPQGAWLTKMHQQQVDTGSRGVCFLLQGKAQSVELVNKLVQGLEQSKSIQKVELINSDTELKGGKAVAEEQVTSFTIKAELKQAVINDNNKLAIKTGLEGKDKVKKISKNSKEVNKEA